MGPEFWGPGLEAGIGNWKKTKSVSCEPEESQADYLEPELKLPSTLWKEAGGERELHGNSITALLISDLEHCEPLGKGGGNRLSLMTWSWNQVSTGSLAESEIFSVNMKHET